MSENDATTQEAAELAEINSKPLFSRLGYYARKSGPGWLQAAITLGGGSLAGALFLGVILEYHLMWLQPLAMILGVVMLSAISYVTLSSGQRPFQAIGKHVSPILAWAWLIAAMMANIVWCLPQFALGTGAIQQNLIPSLESVGWSQWAIGGVLLVSAAVVVRAYDSDNKGVRAFEMILKAMVGIVVISFFLVVARLTVGGSLDWGAIFKGFVPNLTFLQNPAPAVAEAIAATGDNADSWTSMIAGIQKDKIIAAFGTAVGINMTFLLPYSMIRKSWSKPHRGLAIFDLSIGLIVPFLLATSCIVIAAASQFHGKTSDILGEDGTVIESKAGSFAGVADKFIAIQFAEDLAGLEGEARGAKVEEIRNGLAIEDKRVAAMLVDRKDSDLARALSALAGEGVMLINGFCLCEALGMPGNRHVHFLGSLIPGLIGICFPFIWSGESKAALAVPTSVIGSSLLPIAYFIFLLLMNSRRLLGEAMLTGITRLAANAIMLLATGLATVGSIWALKDKSLSVLSLPTIPLGKIGIGVLALLFVIGVLGFVSKSRKSA